MNRKPPLRPSNADQHALRPRRVERLKVDGTASLHQQNWYDIEVTMKDVSSCGFKAECLEPVRIGSYVSLDVPGIGPVQAQVRWQIGRKMGGMFLDPISLSRCEWTATPATPPLAPA